MDPYKARKYAKIIAIVIVVAMVVTSFSFLLVLAEDGSHVYGASSRDEYVEQQLSMLNEYIDTIELMYKDEVDYETLMDGAFSGVVDSLGDPYSVYYGNPKDGQEFVDTVNSEFYGVGVSLELYNGQPRVTNVHLNTPADAAGIRHGDILVSIDGVETKGKTLDEAIKMLRGAEGSKVTLSFNRDGIQKTYTLVRAKIATPSVGHIMLEDGVGYIYISIFGTNTDQEFIKAYSELKDAGATSLVLDVRNNGGGVINSALNVANQIVSTGTLVSFEKRGKALETIKSTGIRTVNVPIVLLVNENTASASEILAAALQDNKAAKVVGVKTFGKGIAQNVMTMKDGSMLKLSTMYFKRPNGSHIDKIGITPDHVIADTISEENTMGMLKYTEFAPMSEKVVSMSGATGLNVFGAQQRLNLLGYDVQISATMDEKTVAAVAKFQGDAGLYSYGVLDFTTMAAIDRACTEMLTAKGDTDVQLDKALSLLNAS